METRWVKFVIVGALLTTAVVILGISTLSDPESSLVRFTPDQLVAANTTEVASRGVQVDGWVAEGTERFNAERLELRFQVRDAEKTAFIDVVYREGLKPDSFQEGQGVVVSGSYDPTTNTIEASKLMTKCPSKYEANPTDEYQSTNEQLTPKPLKTSL